MAEAFTSYVVDNDKRFRDAMREAGAKLGDLRIPLGLILRDFYKSEKAIFELKGPGQFPPFKHSVAVLVPNKKGKVAYKGTTTMSRYQEQKKKAVGFDYPLLVRSGALAASLLSANAPGSIANIGKLHLIFGTSIKYGIYHQSDAPRKKMPLRKFLFIGPEASQFATSDQMGRLERWLGYLSDYTKKALEKAGTVK